MGKLCADHRDVLSAVSSVASVFTIAVTGFVISIYILSNKKKLLNQGLRILYAYVGKKYADKLCAVAALTNQTFFQLHLGSVCGSGHSRMHVFYYNEHFAASIFSGHQCVHCIHGADPYVGAFLGCVVGALLIVIVQPP